MRHTFFFLIIVILRTTLTKGNSSFLLVVCYYFFLSFPFKFHFTFSCFIIHIIYYISIVFLLTLLSISGNALRSNTVSEHNYFKEKINMILQFMSFCRRAASESLRARIVRIDETIKTIEQCAKFIRARRIVSARAS